MFMSGNRFIFTVILLLSLNGCSLLGLLNATVSSRGYTSKLDIAYDTGVRQKLDIHTPVHVKENADVVIFYYGGRWQSGSKADYAFVADAFTSQGFITVLPDYRLFPAVDWRDAIRDGAKAYQWVRDNIAKRGGNAQRIFVVGHSAGAHIAAMVSVKPPLVSNILRAESRPCGFIGLAGPYDFLPLTDADIIQLFSTEAQLEKTQPIYFLSPDDPRMLLLQGLSDEAVDPGNAYHFAQQHKRQGQRSRAKFYPHVDHIDILLSLSSTFRGSSPALRDSVEFIKKTRCESRLPRQVKQ